MNMFARFDENPAMTLQDIKETKRYGRTDGHNGRTDNVKTVYPPQTKFAGGITNKVCGGIISKLIMCKIVIIFLPIRINVFFECS